MPKGMASHERSEDSNTVWLTPPSLLSFLGEFDLDPCAAPSPRPWSTAKRHIELPEDGLKADWGGEFGLIRHTVRIVVWMRGSRRWQRTGTV